MPAGNRIRDNNVFGVTTDAPLTSGATTFNSLGLAKMSSVVAAHALVTLDPIRQYGEPEVVVVTVHTSAATVATITRGAYGTTARSHPLGTLWVSQPIDEDFIEVLTAATRPTNPYEGQFIFEADTNKLVGYGGVDWAPRDAGGQLAGGYAEAVTSQTGITTVVDLTSLSATVTVATSRRVRISVVALIRRTVADGTSTILIKEGATLLQTVQCQPNMGGGESITCIGSVVLTPSAGSHTYKLQLERSTGTGTTDLYAAANQPAFILVEDIGAA